MKEKREVSALSSMVSYLWNILPGFPIQEEVVTNKMVREANDINAQTVQTIDESEKILHGLSNTIEEQEKMLALLQEESERLEKELKDAGVSVNDEGTTDTSQFLEERHRSGSVKDKQTIAVSDAAESSTLVVVREEEKITKNQHRHDMTEAEKTLMAVQQQNEDALALINAADNDLQNIQSSIEKDRQKRDQSAKIRK